jgi:hypothetical protein
MEKPPERKPFRILHDDEFRALTTQQRVEYLKEAMQVRNSINRQIDAEIGNLLPSSRRRDKS